MSKQDTHFFNVFSVVLGLLVVFMLLMFAFARYIGTKHQTAQIVADPMVLQEVAARIAVPARVAVAGEDNSALTIAPVTATPAGAGPALSVPKDGHEVFEQACTACHGAGIAGAPKAGDAAAWAPRRAKGIETLYKHSIEGFTGNAGVMPAKGGRTDLSDELIRAAVDHMLAM